MSRAEAEALKGKTVSATDVVQYLETVDGLVFCFWLALENRYPGKFSTTDVFDIFEQMSQDAYRNLRHNWQWHREPTRRESPPARPPKK